MRPCILVFTLLLWLLAVFCLLCRKPSDFFAKCKFLVSPKKTVQLYHKVFCQAFIQRIIIEYLSYLHNFLGDTQGYFPVLYSNLTHASICYRMLFHSQCTLDPDRMGIVQNTHSERHARCMSCTLQTVDNAH